jgi:hypothetical protein
LSLSFRLLSQLKVNEQLSASKIFFAFLYFLQINWNNTNSFENVLVNTSRCSSYLQQTLNEWENLMNIFHPHIYICEINWFETFPHVRKMNVSTRCILQWQTETERFKANKNKRKGEIKYKQKNFESLNLVKS